jgi:hypothetical protein
MIWADATDGTAMDLQCPLACRYSPTAVGARLALEAPTATHALFVVQATFCMATEMPIVGTPWSDVEEVVLVEVPHDARTRAAIATTAKRAVMEPETNVAARRREMGSCRSWSNAMLLFRYLSACENLPRCDALGRLN